MALSFRSVPLVFTFLFATVLLLTVQAAVIPSGSIHQAYDKARLDGERAREQRDAARARRESQSGSAGGDGGRMLREKERERRDMEKARSESAGGGDGGDAARLRREKERERRDME